jgi:hypothetical protein
MPVEIDGPAGRQEVTKEYRDNYDRIFSRPSTFHEGVKVYQTTPKKSKEESLKGWREKCQKQKR